MKILIAAQATVQFIGLCIVMSGTPSQPGVHVVLPRVEGLHVPQHGQSTSGAHRHEPKVGSPIDDHKAIIAYPEEALLSIRGWKEQKLKPVAPAGSYRYIALSGEHLQFRTQGSNPKALVPEGLPSLGNKCRFTPQLLSGYTPPEYRKAAAVAKFEAGEVSACAANIQGVQTARVDTKVVLKNNGRLVIETKDQKKQLIFDGDALVIVGNVPQVWLDSDGKFGMEELTDASHYEAYYTLLAKKEGCSRPLDSTAPPCERIAAFRLTASSLTSQKVAPAPPKFSLPAQFSTFSCSNTTYP